jgi:O-methyltransferase involved in polyketide biosynthesis
VSRVSWRLVRTLRNLGFDGTLKSFSGQRYPPQSPSAYSSSKIAFSHKVQLHVNEKRGREREKKMLALSRGCLVAAVFSKNWDSPHNLKNWRSGIKWISNEKRWREESMKTWRFHMNLVFLPGKAEKIIIQTGP